MYHLTIRERTACQRMGREYIAYFKTAKGAPFHKGFQSEQELKAFVAEAKQYGTECVQVIKV